LSADGQSSPVAKPTVTADVDEPFDAHGRFRAQGAFNLDVGVYDGPDFGDIRVRQCLDSGVRIHAGFLQNFLGRRKTDAEDIGQCSLDSLFFWKVYTCDTSHITSISTLVKNLSLTLLVSGILADDADHAAPLDDLALVAYFFDGCANFHGKSTLGYLYR
jgi:hypothetical protein